MVQFLGRGDNENTAILKLQKRVIQIMCGLCTGTSCIQLLKDYKTLTITFLYVLEVICIIRMYKFSLEQNAHVHD